jgi:hypothetical protein
VLPVTEATCGGYWVSGAAELSWGGGGAEVGFELMASLLLSRHS